MNKKIFLVLILLNMLSYAAAPKTVAAIAANNAAQNKAAKEGTFQSTLKITWTTNAKKEKVKLVDATRKTDWQDGTSTKEFLGRAVTYSTDASGKPKVECVTSSSEQNKDGFADLNDEVLTMEECILQGELGEQLQQVEHDHCCYDPNGKFTQRIAVTHSGTFVLNSKRQRRPNTAANSHEQTKLVTITGKIARTFDILWDTDRNGFTNKQVGFQDVYTCNDGPIDTKRIARTVRYDKDRKKFPQISTTCLGTFPILAYSDLLYAREQEYLREQLLAKDPNAVNDYERGVLIINSNGTIRIPLPFPAGANAANATAAAGTASGSAAAQK